MEDDAANRWPFCCFPLSYENTIIASHPRSRQRWLIFISLGVMTAQRENEAQTNAEARRAFAVIQQLVERWCDRRALQPLRKLLPVYPLHTPHTDGWFDLYRGLKDVQVFCGSELPPDEHEMLRTAMEGIAQVLDQRLGHTQWHV
jgi:hypothetical protein